MATSKKKKVLSKKSDEKNRRLFLRKKPPRSWKLEAHGKRSQPVQALKIYDIGAYGFAVVVDPKEKASILTVGQNIAIVLDVGAHKFSVYARLHYITFPASLKGKGRAGFEFVEPSNELVFFLSGWIADR